MSLSAELEPRLARVAEQLEATGSAAEIYDRQWRLVWKAPDGTTFHGTPTRAYK